jgi:GntR family transcriptional regulator
MGRALGDVNRSTSKVFGLEVAMTGYRQLADELRTAILSGQYPPGSTLPGQQELANEHGVALLTVRRAVNLLEAEGLLDVVRRRGTVVRTQPRRHRLRRDRKVYRDERGYYFDRAAQPWVAVQPPTVSWGPCPADIADLLGIAPGSEVLIRDRVMGDPDTHTSLQLATSYLPADLARGTVLAERDTGPGGIYDRLEEMGHGPLHWTETLTARAPLHHEAQALRVPPGVPLLRITRITSNPDGHVLEVNDTRISASGFEIGYPLDRSVS